MTKQKKSKKRINTNKIVAIIMLIASVALYISSIVYQLASMGTK